MGGLSLREFYVHSHPTLYPLTHSRGNRFEEILFHRLEKVTYFLKEKECDFVLQHEDIVLQLIQVCWQMEDAETRAREIAGLLEARKVTHCDNLYIITHHQEETIEQDGWTIHVVPAWKWMLTK